MRFTSAMAMPGSLRSTPSTERNATHSAVLARAAAGCTAPMMRKRTRARLTFGRRAALVGHRAAGSPRMRWRRPRRRDDRIRAQRRARRGIATATVRRSRRHAPKRRIAFSLAKTPRRAVHKTRPREGTGHKYARVGRRCGPDRAPLAVLSAYAIYGPGRSQRLASCPCVMSQKTLRLRREVEYRCSRNTI